MKKKRVYIQGKEFESSKSERVSSLPNAAKRSNNKSIRNTHVNFTAQGAWWLWQEWFLLACCLNADSGREVSWVILENFMETLEKEEKLKAVHRWEGELRMQEERLEPGEEVMRQYQQRGTFKEEDPSLKGWGNGTLNKGGAQRRAVRTKETETRDRLKIDWIPTSWFPMRDSPAISIVVPLQVLTVSL